MTRSAYSTSASSSHSSDLISKSSSSSSLYFSSSLSSYASKNDIKKYFDELNKNNNMTSTDHEKEQPTQSPWCSIL
jgi:hypothetical protein